MNDKQLSEEQDKLIISELSLAGLKMEYLPNVKTIIGERVASIVGQSSIGIKRKIYLENANINIAIDIIKETEQKPIIKEEQKDTSRMVLALRDLKDRKEFNAYLLEQKAKLEIKLKPKEITLDNLQKCSYCEFFRKPNKMKEVKDELKKGRGIAEKRHGANRQVKYAIAINQSKKHVGYCNYTDGVEKAQHKFIPIGNPEISLCYAFKMKEIYKEILKLKV